MRPSSAERLASLARKKTASVGEESASATAVSTATAVAADDWSAEHEPGTRKTLDINGVEFAFRYCPGGSVAVGEPGAEKVCVLDGYWTLETEVTCAMWKAIVGRDQSQWGPESDMPGPWRVEIPEKYANDPAVQRCVERAKKVDADKFPADCVDWQMTQDFVGKLNAAGVAPEGFEFRLPTEAEWERACRAGTTTRYYWGDEWNVDKAHTRASALSERRITNVGIFLYRPVEVGLCEPNPWGLYDMFGNVAEWTSDEFVDADGRRCWIIRGGSWATRSDDYREDFREGTLCSGESYYGLRVVLGRKAPK